MDEAERQKRLQEVVERNKILSALTVNTIQAHLLCEQTLGEYLLEKSVKNKWLRKATFAEKVEKAKSLSIKEGDRQAWEVLTIANQLRNTVAHSLSMDRMDSKVAQLREAYVAWLPPRPAAYAAEEPADEMAQGALWSCTGFLATLTDRARAEKAAEAKTQ